MQTDELSRLEEQNLILEELVSAIVRYLKNLKILCVYYENPRFLLSSFVLSVFVMA